MIERLAELLKQVTGYIYPNEIEIHWSILIVVYPYLTGLVAGRVHPGLAGEGVQRQGGAADLPAVAAHRAGVPAHRAAAAAAAPRPSGARRYEIFLTPNLTSAMAMFGFVYAWYLMVVLLLEIWFDYRKDLIVWRAAGTRPDELDPPGAGAVLQRRQRRGGRASTSKAVKIITIIGIPSAFLLHGYVGFIFGSVKANPWWSSVLMPIVFLFSAIVSGIALVHAASTW